MVRVIPDDDVRSLIDLETLLPVVADGFAAQYAGAVERPERPHYPIGSGLETVNPEQPLGTGLCMPAYVHGSPYVVTKLATVFEGNEARGLPTVSARIAVDDAETGQPLAYLAGTAITNARTGCIGGLAARELARKEPVSLAVIGAGAQARWQTRAIDAATDLESVRVYSPSDSRVRCAADLDGELSVPVEAVSSPVRALEGASVVVTATTSTEPVFDGGDLEAGALVIAVGAYTPDMRELDDRTLERAERVYADVPEEARETGDLCVHPDLEVDDFGGRFVDEGTVTSPIPGRQSPDEILVLSSVGSAVFDAVTASQLYERARDEGVGTVVDL
ncbi:ornithine cyclodeaminase family protein [Natrialbaceae archaeon A-CW2]